MLVYLDRYIEKQAEVPISNYNIHRLLAVIIYVVHKFHSDEVYKIKYYAIIAGIPNEELKHLEVEFLFLLSFDLIVEPKTYLEYKSTIIAYSKKITACTGKLYPIELDEEDLLIKAELEKSLELVPAEAKDDSIPRSGSSAKPLILPNPAKREKKNSYTPQFLSHYIRGSKKIAEISMDNNVQAVIPVLMQ